MYEKEEQRLEELRTELEQQPLPTDLTDAAIIQGLAHAKRDKAKKRATWRRSAWTIAAAAVLVLVFSTSIRVSPAFAHAVASIPGMDKFVELIQLDKGLSAVFDHEYYEEIGVSQEIGNASLTIDGVILDESGMNIFYTITSAEGINDLTVDLPVLKNNGREMKFAAVTYYNPQQDESKHLFKDMIGYQFEDALASDNFDFHLSLRTEINDKEFAFEVPFDVKEAIKPSKSYTIKEPFEVDGQQFTVDQIIIHPLRIEVRVTENPANTKKILQFEDMRIEDEDGEVWGSIANGLSAYGDHAVTGKRTLFLQSNYFEQPDELFFRINRIQAVDKEDAVLVIDTDTKELLNSPKDGRVALTSASRREVELEVQISGSKGFHYGIIDDVRDADGKIVTPEWVSSSFSEEATAREGIRFDTVQYKNPLQIELFAYPSYIETDIKAKLTKEQ